MTSEYDNIFSRFYLRIQDYEIVGLEEKLVKKMLIGYMKQTLSMPYIRRLFLTMSVDDDLEEIEYEMKYATTEDEDLDFVEEVIALGMVVAWLEPKYNSTLNTSQFFSNTDLKFYSQANHMVELKNMYNLAKNNLRKIIRDRGYIYNGYLSEA